LVPIFVFQILNVEGAKLVVNYGINKARFPAPVPSGSRVRMGGEIAAVEPVSGGLQLTLNCTFEIEGQAKPACVAEILFRYYE
jgi:acyl dehydratase